MDSLLVALATVGSLLALLAAGIPVAFAMATVAIVGLYLSVGERFLLSTIETLPYNIASQYTFVVVPMFVLMGIITSKSGLVGDLYTAAYRLTSRVRGSLYMTTILSSGAFAAASGSTVVSSGVFTRMALPEMRRLGYPPGVSAGCIAAAGTLAAMIPPSIAMVLYAVLTDQSIGALLIAGIVPGLLSMVAFMVGIRLFLVFRPDWAPETTERFSLAEKGSAILKVWGIALLALLVIGGIYMGWFSPSAAGAVGAAGALLISLAQGRLSGRDLWASLVDAAKISATIFLIIMAGLLLSRFLLISGVIREANDLVTTMAVDPAVFLAVVVVVFLVLGMFVDAISMLVLTLPFLFPVSQALGIDPIWFGVVVTKLVEIAAITPPVGLNLYAVLSTADRQVTAGALFRGVLPFLVIELVVLAILLSVPALATWLPSRMLG